MFTFSDYHFAYACYFIYLVIPFSDVISINNLTIKILLIVGDF